MADVGWVWPAPAKGKLGMVQMVALGAAICIRAQLRLLAKANAWEDGHYGNRPPVHYRANLEYVDSDNRGKLEVPA